ncbi:hypothetical protein ACP70R_019268 [Stipagrostis hirtigluma subsp. patula]
MTGPGLFSDIGKRTKGTASPPKLCLPRATPTTRRSRSPPSPPPGCGVTSTAVKKGGLNSLDISSVYKHKNTDVSINVDSESNISATLTVLEALPYTNLVTSIKLPNYIAGELELQCFHEYASFAAVVGMKPSLVVELSGTVGGQGVSIGAEGRYDAAKQKFTKFSAGMGVTKQDFHAAFVLADKGDTIKVSSLYHFDEKQKVSAVAEFKRKLSSSKNRLTVGGLYTVDAKTLVKARLSNTGKLAALLQHKFETKSFVTISGEFNTKALDRLPKIGLALCYSPEVHEPNETSCSSLSPRHGSHSKARSRRRRSHHSPSPPSQ